MSKRYIELVLDFIEEKTKEDNAFMFGELREYVLNLNNKITINQIKAGLQNFVTLSLIGALGDEVYQLNIEKINSFYEQYTKGTIPIWAKKKTSIDENNADNKKNDIEKLPNFYKNNQTFYLRAMFAAFPGPFYTIRLMELSKKNGFQFISRKAIENIRRNIKDCFDFKGYREKMLLFSMNQKFFEKFQDEKELYKLVFPERKDFIDSSFIKAIGEQKDIKENVENIKKIKKPFDHKPRYIAAAIFAAYKKPLSSDDIVRIASNYGYQVKSGTINAYCLKQKGKSLLVTDKRINQLIYSPGEIFFKNHYKKIDLLVEILPDKKSQIIARFNSFYQRDDRVDQTEEDNAPIDQAAAVNTEDETLLNEDEGEYVEAARVGASIIKYIRTLQTKLKKRDEDPTALNELRDKIEQGQLYNVNLKNENQNLHFQIEKLKSMLEASNEKLISLNHQLSILKNRRQNEKEPVPAKFTLSEVARMTQFVKDSRGNGKQEKTD